MNVRATHGASERSPWNLGTVGTVSPGKPDAQNQNEVTILKVIHTSFSMMFYEKTLDSMVDLGAAT